MIYKVGDFCFGQQIIMTNVQKLTKEQPKKTFFLPYLSYNYELNKKPKIYPKNQTLMKKPISNDERHMKSKSFIQLSRVILLVSSIFQEITSGLFPQKYLGVQKLMKSSLLGSTGLPL